MIIRPIKGQITEYGFLIALWGDFTAGGGMNRKSKYAGHGFCRGSTLVTLASRRKQTDNAIKRQSLVFDIFHLPSSATLDLSFCHFADVGSSRGCSPLRPSQGCKAPLTRRNAKRSSLGCAAVSITGIIPYGAFPLLRFTYLSLPSRRCRISSILSTP